MRHDLAYFAWSAHLASQNPNDEEIWVGGGAVDRVTMTLSVKGDDLDPDQVTSMMGSEPTASWRRGDPWKYGNGSRPFGMWLISEEAIPGRELEGRMHRLLDRLPAEGEFWAALHDQFGVRISLGLFLQASNRGLVFSPLLVRRLGDRGLEVNLDIYSRSDEE